MEQLLQGSTKVALLALTLSAGIDQLLNRYAIDNLSYALLLDAAASALVEKVADELQQEIEDTTCNDGLFCLPRFSPGYGDLSLDVQLELLAALDATRRIGLTVNSNNILLPRKSITALIAMKPEKPLPLIGGDICSGCQSDANCPYSSCIKRGKS